MEKHFKHSHNTICGTEWLHLFDQKYSKDSNILKYFYNLK